MNPREHEDAFKKGSTVGLVMQAQHAYAIVTPAGKAVYHISALMKVAGCSRGPRYLIIVKPQGTQEAVVGGAGALYFTRQIGLLAEIQVVPVVGSLVDDATTVRRAILGIRQGNEHLSVFFALFDNADNWVNIVLLTTAQVIRLLTWEGVNLGGVLYLHLDNTGEVTPQRLELPPLVDFGRLGKPAYNVLKVIAGGVDTAREVHRAYVREYGEVSRRLIVKALGRLIKAGLVERSGAANNYKYTLTPLGRLIVG
jgi:hypothetical protein